MPHQNSTIIIEQTKQWLEKMVIGLNFCPFAKGVFVQQKIRYVVTDANTVLHTLLDEFRWLDNKKETATTLIIIPDLVSFDLFLNTSYVAEELLGQMGYEGIYQIATFHPNYCFEGTEMEDVTNYTNKSPFAILHLLREADIELALDFYKNPDEIPANNIAKTRATGKEKLHAILQSCLN